MVAGSFGAHDAGTTPATGVSVRTGSVLSAQAHTISAMNCATGATPRMAEKDGEQMGISKPDNLIRLGAKALHLKRQMLLWELSRLDYDLRTCWKATRLLKVGTIGARMIMRPYRDPDPKEDS